MKSGITSKAMSQLFNVCKTSDIPMGEARMFVVNELSIGVFNVAGKFLAINDHCPHAGASLAHGIVEGDACVSVSSPSDSDSFGSNQR